MKEKIDKKQLVLDTALEMIVENGIQSASMGKISKASGVAVGTIYHHFASKEELITELYRIQKMRFLKVFEQIEGEDGGKLGLREMFSKTVHAYVKFATEYRKEFEFINRFHKSPLIDEKVRMEIEREMYSQNTMIAGLISNKDILKDMDIETILIFINGALTYTVGAYLDGEIEMDDKKWDGFIEMLWDGISK